ncbi:MAG: hypothetical protein KF779_03245 [Hyphomonadaceae bacterium]|nr:hypothetical protein [Hyphomonadaceae bacterium]
MNLANILFGQRPAGGPPTLDAPPEGVRFHRVRAKDAPAKRAWIAESDSVVQTEHGQLQARGGQDYILAHGPDDHSVIRRDIFEAMYEPLGGGLYRKRKNVIFRYFTLKRRVVVQTLEGPQVAKPGDWIMQGVKGELWPVSPEKAREKYEPA